MLPADRGERASGCLLGWVRVGWAGVALAAWLRIPQTSGSLASWLFICLSACPSGLEKLAGSHQSLNHLPTIRPLEFVLFYY